MRADSPVMIHPLLQQLRVVPASRLFLCRRPENCIMISRIKNLSHSITVSRTYCSYRGRRASSGLSIWRKGQWCPRICSVLQSPHCQRFCLPVVPFLSSLLGLLEQLVLLQYYQQYAYCSNMRMYCTSVCILQYYSRLVLVQSSITSSYAYSSTSVVFCFNLVQKGLSDTIATISEIHVYHIRAPTPLSYQNSGGILREYAYYSYMYMHMNNIMHTTSTRRVVQYYAYESYERNSFYYSRVVVATSQSSLVPDTHIYTSQLVYIMILEYKYELVLYVYYLASSQYQLCMVYILREQYMCTLQSTHVLLSDIVRVVHCIHTRTLASSMHTGTHQKTTLKRLWRQSTN